MKNKTILWLIEVFLSVIFISSIILLFYTIINSSHIINSIKSVTLLQFFCIFLGAVVCLSATCIVGVGITLTKVYEAGRMGSKVVGTCKKCGASLLEIDGGMCHNCGEIEDDNATIEDK